MKMTIEPALTADALRSDSRLETAKRLIMEAVADHQMQLTEVRPPHPDLRASYEEMLKSFGLIRGGDLYFPYISSGLGNGPFVELADGSVKLDFITGIGVHGFGHSHPLILEAGVDAILSDTVMQGNLQQGAESYQLVRLLTEIANESGANLDHCFLCGSGAMANENALKIAFHKNHPANRIIAFEHCFAGRTLVLSQITDKAKNREGLPDTIPVDYIPFFDEADPQGSTRRAVAELKRLIARYPGKHAAMMMELIQGEGGYYVGDSSFFKALIKIARDHNIATIADEIQTFCRTTRPFAFQHFGLDGMIDLVTIGKISQVCATLYCKKYQPAQGLISQTFTGNSWSIIASQRIIRALVDNGQFGADGRNVRLHQRFVRGLQSISESVPGAVTGPFGMGAMVGFTPLDGSLAKAKEMVHRLFHAGLMSFVAGSNPVRIRFLMPLGCTEDAHIDTACQILHRVAAEMARE
jgi:acetylornithine aminotransferase